MSANFHPIRFQQNRVQLLDQTKLPLEETYLECADLEAVAQAIEKMVVRGAPAIGITAAYGIVVAAEAGLSLAEADARLRKTRPTAVNLFWALDRMKGLWSHGASLSELSQEAEKIHVEDAESCKKMGEIGAELIPEGATILTHCNAGALATAAWGTALAVIRMAHLQGKNIKVFAGETRPWLQGARLTTWELMKDGIEVTLVCDSAVAHLLGQGEIDCAVTGADRIAKNGDVANKIGTRGIACLMKAHEKPFYVAAPWSTIDMSLDSGEQIVIEERDSSEVVAIRGQRTAPEGVKTRNPAFDVTPASWIDGVITERGFTGKAIAQGLAKLDEQS